MSCICQTHMFCLTGPCHWYYKLLFLTLSYIYVFLSLPSLFAFREATVTFCPWLSVLCPHLDRLHLHHLHFHHLHITPVLPTPSPPTPAILAALDLQVLRARQHNHLVDMFALESRAPTFMERLGLVFNWTCTFKHISWSFLRPHYKIAVAECAW